MKRNRVVVLLSDQELQHVKTLAGLVSVSAWIRAQVTGKEIGAESLIPILQRSIAKSKEVANGPTKLREHGDSAPVSNGAVDVGDARPSETDDEGPASKPLRGKTCIHGTPKGHRCWQCGGIAQV